MRRHIDEPMPTEEEFLRERWHIYHCEWDLEDIETNTEGPFTPYFPSRDDLDAWLAHWRAIYPDKFAIGQFSDDQAIKVRAKNAAANSAIKAAAVKEEVTHTLPDGLRKKSQNWQASVSGAFDVEHDSHVDARVKVDWDPHSEGLKALEEGMGQRMEHGVKALLRKMRK